MENLEKIVMEQYNEYCREYDGKTNDLNWYYWRIHRLEHIVELLLRENEALKEIAGFKYKSV